MNKSIHKNLILDLGGVILDINYQNTIDAFKAIGIEQAETLYSQQSQNPLFDLLEKGMISEGDFFSELRKLSKTDHSDDVLRKCWNAILVGLPEENLKTLYELKKNYRLFLLSNTNSIHESEYRKMIVMQYGSFVFDDIFEKMYLSCSLKFLTQRKRRKKLRAQSRILLKKAVQGYLTRRKRKKN